MAEPRARRKPATEIELKLSAGDASAAGALVDLLDGPLHRYLVNAFPFSLCAEDREDVIAEFIADLIAEPDRYDASRASIGQYARSCVRNKALDLIARKRTQLKFMNGPGVQEALRLTTDDVAKALDSAAIMERAEVAVERFDPKYRAALRAFWKHDASGYKRSLVDEFGITGATAATWLARAKKMLSEALGPSVDLEP